MSGPSVFLFTDFGPGGPYLGQIHAVLAREAPAARVIDLLADAPRCNPRPAAYLLAALAALVPEGSILLAVVDPGVGDPGRVPVVARAQGRWLVGPGNGLFERATRTDPQRAFWRITLAPARLSRTFHGRDLFAPVAARLARGELPAGGPDDPPGEPFGEPMAPPPPPFPCPDDLYEVIYLDPYGNAMTGIEAGAVPSGAHLACQGIRFAPATTFAEVEPGAPLWYENSCGLVELALNQGSLAARLPVGIGAAVTVG